MCRHRPYPRIKDADSKNGLGAKCVSTDTLIPLWNGKIKRADEITLDDTIIGDDGQIRNIQKIIKGSGQMYEITQTKGESYKVNDNHTLTLHMPSHKIIFWNSAKNGWSTIVWDNDKKCVIQKTVKLQRTQIKCPECETELVNSMEKHFQIKHSTLEIPNELKKKRNNEPIDTEESKLAYKQIEDFCKTFPDSSEFNMNIQDYMKLNKTTKNYLAGIRADCIQWTKKEILLDPYVLGLWLGDGESRGWGYSCDGDNDKEIIKYLEEWCNNNSAKIKKAKQKYTYYISSNSDKIPISPFTTLLKHYNLIHNKHIPLDYIVNDRDTRLKVLAGIIDTDGHVQNDGTRIEITQCFEHEQLVKDIVLLARSLGFYCCLTTRKTSWRYKGELKKGKCYNINISGNIEDIPTQLPRKKCANIRVQSNKSTGKIRINDIGKSDYIGIGVDSNQRLLVNDFTVTHNCTNIYSDLFIIEIVDGKRKLKYYQEFSNNMYDKTEPVVEKLQGKPKSYTKITFKPDYKRFKLKGLSNDMISLFKKRVYDVAAVTNVKVFLNDKHIKIADFEDYIKMYYEDEEIPHPPVYEVVNDRWKVAVVYDPNSGYRQISYVNGICTYQGGAHVQHVLDQVVGTLYDQICSKNKDLKIKPATIRDNLTFFIDAVIEDPGFSSQTKEFLTTKMVNFGSKCEISDKFIKALTKTGIVEEVVNFAKFKANAEVNKLGGNKRAKLIGLHKLVDAHWAGTRKSQLCTLILTEGDSAKSYAIAGTEIIGKERYGVFPLRGKLLNVREANPAQLLKNEEIKNVMQIMGLKPNKTYKNVNQLRYGRILVLTDQDYDGSHIKGLICNFIHYFWPSLLEKIPGFITEYLTPIVKVWKKSDIKKKNIITFTSLVKFNDWKEEIGDNIRLYNVKYYKGLGTSTKEEAKESFLDFDNKIIQFIWNTNENENDATNIQDNMDQEEDNNDPDAEETDTETKSNVDTDEFEQIDKSSPSYDALTLAFAKTRSNDRKTWLGTYNKNTILDVNAKYVTYDEFINKDLIHFSNYDCMRSIPSLCDGFKPSLRKILYGCILKKIFKQEIKVAQLSGYIAENTGYHHGEVSLQGAIVGMAQNFVGSNNIYWLIPQGNFGDRLEGGKNAASARYINTLLNELTPLVFRKEDECIYTYNDDDGTVVEPESFAPIICNTLINWIEGIGTGFSTNILPFNPLDVIKNQRLIIQGKKPIKMTPWFRGFIGKVVTLTDTTFETHGLYEIKDENTIVITELPIGTWTVNYKGFLETLLIEDPKKPVKGQILTDMKDDCGIDTIKFTLTFADDELQSLIKRNEIMKRLKLINKHSMSNMHLYNTKGIIQKYESVEEILCEFCEFRLNMYTKRKEYYMKVLENDLNIITWRIKFIDSIISGKIIVFENKKPRSKGNVIEQLVKQGFPTLHTNSNALENDKSYDYLTNLKIFDLTEEERNILQNEYDKKLQIYNDYKEKSIQQLWLDELNEFETAYKKWLKEQEEERLENDKKFKKQGAKKIGRGKK